MDGNLNAKTDANQYDYTRRRRLATTDHHGQLPTQKAVDKTKSWSTDLCGWPAKTNAAKRRR